METNLKPSPAEALYRTMHNCNELYRINNQGLLTICDWLHLLLRNDGSIHDPWNGKPISILDVGCGNGKLCSLLSELKLDVTGIDIVEGPYERAKYKFIKHDLTEIPYPFRDGKFDYCLNFDVMEHLPEDQTVYVLQEMARISDNGIFVKIACSGIPPLHINVKTPGWWLNKLITNCPEFSWRMLRNYKRYDTPEISYAPLFYGKRGPKPCG